MVYLHIINTYCTTILVVLRRQQSCYEHVCYIFNTSNVIFNKIFVKRSFFAKPKLVTFLQTSDMKNDETQHDIQ